METEAEFYPLLVIGSDLSSEIQPVWQPRLLCLSLHNVGNTAVGDTVKLTCHYMSLIFQETKLFL